MITDVVARIALAASLLLHPSPQEWEGFGAHYSPGVMERVSKNRRMEVVGCMIVSPWHNLGDWLVLTSPIDNDSLLCRVTDVAHPRDAERLLAKRWFELDWESAKVLCNISRVGQEPPRDCPLVATLPEAGGE